MINTLREEAEVGHKECLAYSDKLNTLMMKNFEIPGVVNNHDFKSDVEAAAKNQYYNLTTWLTQNDIDIRAEIEQVTEKIFKMMKEDKRLQSCIDNNTQRCELLDESIEKTNMVVAANKKEIEGKSNRLFSKIEKGDKELAEADIVLKELIWKHKKENA